METQNPESRNLDLLRAVAVLCVFGSHLILSLMPSHHALEHIQTPAVAFLYGMGNAGVLLFFVHTSLVLLLSLARTRQHSLFLNFYIRRFFRIYPLSVACVLLVLLLRVPVVPELPFAMPGWHTVLSNLLLIQNLTHTGDIISPLWTLPLEVQMYVALPFIFVLLRWIGSGPLVLILWWCTAAVAPHAPLLRWVPCFMGGVFAYQVGREKTYRMPAALWPLFLLSMLSLYLWFHVNIMDNSWPDCVLCIVLGSFLPHCAELAQSWFTAACGVIARYSYGIYLSHLPIIWFAFFKLHALSPELQWTIFGFLMCAVPWAAFRWLEAPLIAVGRRLADQLTRTGPIAAAPLLEWTPPA